jgi:hypothetical protein
MIHDRECEWNGEEPSACQCKVRLITKAADALAKAARYCKDRECKPWPCKAMNDALTAYEKVRGK